MIFSWTRMGDILIKHIIKILKKVGNTKYYIQTFRKYDTNRLKYSGRVLRKPFKKS